MDNYKEDQFTVQEIKKRSFIGVMALTSRTFILQIVALAATFILTVLLDPAAFGIFFIVTAIVNFLNYFSDIGLAAALIQKKEEPSKEDLATTFTIQQMMVGLIVFIAIFWSRSIAGFYRLDSGGLFLFRALIISFMLSSLKTIPSILLERRLQFQKLVIPQIIETVVFYSVAIVLAYKRIGITSFAWAALLRGISGTVVLYLVAPWKPQLMIKKENARRLLAFGLPYQANSFLALLKDDLLTLFLGRILPFSAVGYIGWAKKWSEMSLRLIMDNIIKVTFPTYSRLQHDPKLLQKAIEKSLLFLSLLTFPIAIGLIFMIRPFIEIVPKYIKWEPALFSFYLFTFSSILATISSPLVNALNAVGKVKYTFYLMIIWTGLTWVLVPPMVHLFGYNGVAMSAVIISLTSFMPIFFIKKIVPLSFIKSIIKPAISTVIMAIVLLITTSITPEPVSKLVLGFIIGTAIYALLAYLFMKNEILPYLKFLKHPD